MEIKKIFTQMEKSMDCEGRKWEWVDTDKDYDEIKKDLGGYIWSVRIVEKIFDSETFKINIRVLKETTIEYVNHSINKKELVERIYAE